MIEMIELEKKLVKADERYKKWIDTALSGKQL